MAVLLLALVHVPVPLRHQVALDKEAGEKAHGKERAHDGAGRVAGAVGLGVRGGGGLNLGGGAAAACLGGTAAAAGAAAAGAATAGAASCSWC